MKRNASLAALLLILGLSSITAAEPTPDLTAKDGNTYHAHIGQVVSLSGLFGEGMPGASVTSPAPQSIIVYLISDLTSGSYSRPESFQKLMGQQVQVTGKLLFQHFPPAKRDTDQTPYDYYYMVTQHTKVEPAPCR